MLFKGFKRVLKTATAYSRSASCFLQVRDEPTSDICTPGGDVVLCCHDKGNCW